MSKWGKASCAGLVLVGILAADAEALDIFWGGGG